MPSLRIKIHNYVELRHEVIAFWTRVQMKLTKVEYQLKLLLCTQHHKNHCAQLQTTSPDKYWK